MLMSTRLNAQLLTFLLVVVSAFAQDDDQFSSDITKLRTDLEAVASGGHWQRDGQEGTFRLVIRLVGFEHLRNQVYLQWIRQSDDPDQPSVIERTVTVGEISGWRVSGPRFVLDKKQWKIIVSAERENVLEGTSPTRRRFFTIVPAADYSYRIVESEVRPRI